MGDYSPSKGHVAFNTVGAAGGIGWLAEQVGLFGNGCGNNGGLFNNNNNNGNCPVGEKEFQWAQAYNAKEAELAKEKSERYADSVSLGVYEQLVAESKEINAKQDANYRELAAAVAQQKEDSAVLRSDIRCLAVTNQKEHEALKSSFESALALESERRLCGDETLLTYVNSNFIKGALKLNADDICPEVQLRCPPVTQVELVTQAVATAVAQAIGSTSAKAVAK